MTQILAAIDNSPAALPVIETALWLSRLLGYPVGVVRVREDGFETASAVPQTRDLSVSVVERDPVDALVAALDAPDVLVGVIGARGTHSGRRPAGHVALAVAQAVATPVVVVPPQDSVGPRVDTTGRILVPVDDALQSGAAARGVTRLFAGSDAEIVVLHVFEAATVPRFWDQPHHAAQSWSREFLARHLHRADTDLELRSGVPGISVLEVVDQNSADLIALSWAQDLSTGRARTIQEVLALSKVPVLLMPQGHSIEPAIVSHAPTGGL